MNLHLIFLSVQVLSCSWGISPSGISQEESSPMGGSVARLLGPCRRSPSPSTKLCRSLTGLFLSFMFGLEANRDMLNPRPDTDLCVAVSTPVSAPDGCVRAGVSCFATYKDGWMSLKSAQHRPKPASADVSGDFHVDLESRFSENATFVFTLLPRVKWSVWLSEGRPVGRNSKPHLLMSQVGCRVGWEAGIVLTWWTRSSGCVSAGHIHAGCCSVPRRVPGAMRFIIQFLTRGQTPSVN